LYDIAWGLFHVRSSVLLMSLLRFGRCVCFMKLIKLQPDYNPFQSRCRCIPIV
jgi:hypothetical protein